MKVFKNRNPEPYGLTKDNQLYHLPDLIRVSGAVEWVPKLQAGHLTIVGQGNGLNKFSRVGYLPFIVVKSQIYNSGKAGLGFKKWFLNFKPSPN